jgi:hypothetical protein
MNRLTSRKPLVLIAMLTVVVGVLMACSSSGDDSQPGATEVTTPSAEPDMNMFTVQGDPSLNSSYVITMQLLDGYEGGDVVFGSDGGQGISTWAVGNVFADPCHSNHSLLDPPIGPSVDELVTGLASQKGHPSTTPTDVEVDGYAGEYLEMQVPAGTDVADCQDGKFRTWPDRFLESGQRDMLWIIDVDGDRLVIDSALGPNTTPQDRADRTRMVESIQIEPV